MRKTNHSAFVRNANVRFDVKRIAKKFNGKQLTKGRSNMANARIKRLVKKIASPYASKFGGGKAYNMGELKRRGQVIRKIVGRRIKFERGQGYINRNVGGKDYRTSL